MTAPAPAPAQRKRPDIEHWRNQALFQNRRKNVWKLRCHLSWGVIAVLFASAFAFWLGSKREPQFTASPVPRSAPADCAAETLPAHVWATVRIYNSGHQWSDSPCSCSATVISKGDKWGLCLGAGHCFKGNIGAQFWACLPDDRITVATLLGHEPAGNGGGDLALFRIPAADVIDTAPLWDGKTEPKSLDVIGYPGGVGPERLRLGGPAKISTAHESLFPVLDGGKIIPGNSGSGVFADGHLCGVIGGWASSPAEARTGSDYDHLLAFIATHNKKLKGCRDGKCQLPAPDPDETDQITPPPGFDGRTPPFAKPNWKAQPKGTLPPIPDYDGCGRPPVGYRHPRERSQHIIAIEKVLEQLDGKAGKDGRDGKDGAPGRDGTPGVVDPAAIAAEVKKQIASLPPAPRPGPAIDPSTLSEIQSKLALLMQGVTVRMMDQNGRLTDENTYPPGVPIELQVVPVKSPVERVKPNGQ